ncbi:MAG: hypothetical protein COA78_28380 [Blastopirellula sp.]|nr:MAG: hypothetical protein COA78_28380 [Blastopirellula sp.]
MISYERELIAIKAFYANQYATRSGTPYMNHINEGLAILKALEAPEMSNKIFCLHPLHMIVNITWSDAYMRVLEYHEKNGIKRNNKHSDDIDILDLSRKLGGITREVLYALLADKIQNQKDFEIYHQHTHPRRIELTAYFSIWIDTLRQMLGI